MSLCESGMGAGHPVPQSAERTLTTSGFTDFFSAKCLTVPNRDRAVSKDNDLLVLRQLDQPLNHGLLIALVKRGYWIVEDKRGLVAFACDVGQKCRNGNDPIFSLAQDIGETTLRGTSKLELMKDSALGDF